MRKITLTLIAVVLATASIFSFTGCGKTTNSESSNTEAVTTEAVTTEPVTTESVTEGKTPEQELAEYIESDEFQSQLDTMKSSYESVMDIDVKADGQSVIYVFTYKTDLPEESLDTVKSTLEEAFDSMSSTYEGIANDLKNEGLDNPSVVIEINAKDGSNIFSKTYKATK